MHRSAASSSSAASSAEQPATVSSSSISAEQPPTSLRSAAQPASKKRALDFDTPLYDNLIANLEAHCKSPSGEAFLDYITDCCFYGQLLTMDEYGDSIETPVPVSVKMEELLRAAQGQRE